MSHEPEKRFNIGKKLTEVRGVYGGGRLPSLFEKSGGIGSSPGVGVTPASGTPAAPTPTPTPAPSVAGSSASSAFTLRSSNGSRVRYSYQDAGHGTTHSTKLRAAHRAELANERTKQQTAQKKEAAIRKRKMQNVQGNGVGIEYEEERAKGNHKARALLREIGKYTRKLHNCQAELKHRKLEYIHVLAGGELLDNSLEQDFDSDAEADYSIQQYFLSGQNGEGEEEEEGKGPAAERDEEEEEEDEEEDDMSADGFSSDEQRADFDVQPPQHPEVD